MKRLLSKVMIGILLIGQILSVTSMVAGADNSANVVTIGENLSEEQKQSILDFFGVSEGSVEIVYVTNADERELLSGHYTDEEIGTKTYSCAYIHITSSGGIQAKIGNLNRVTSADIAQMLALSGVYNCEVLTAAPFEVSGTGALTGVMMAYEQASDVQLDPVKKDVAVKAIETKEKIADTVGKEEATLVVNDIAIHIIRDNVKDESAVVSTVDEVVQTTQSAMEERTQLMGAAPSGLIGQTEKEALYDFGRKLAETDYDYEAMKPTLQRVTRTAAQNAEVNDPIIETFDSSDLVALPEDSILRSGDDEAMGDIIVNSTADMATSAGEVVSLTTDSIELVPVGQVSYEEVQTARNMYYNATLEPGYSTGYSDGQSVIVGQNGETILEVSGPYSFSDVWGERVLVEYDETAQETADDGEESENTQSDSDGGTGITMPSISDKVDSVEAPGILKDEPTYKYGIVDIEGNILLSCAFDEIFSTFNHPWSETSGTYGYGDFGYYPVVYEGTFGYASSNGEITCLTDIEMNGESNAIDMGAQISNLNFIDSNYAAGCAALHVAEDSTVYLIAADGVITELGNASDFMGILPQEFSGGALWYCCDSEGTSLYLMDWHGNILLDGYWDYDMSMDGKTLYVQTSTGYDKYEIRYLGSLAGSGSAQAQGQTGQVQGQAVPGDGGTPVQENADAAASAVSAKDLLEQAAALISEDMAANQESILSLLRSAKTELDAQNPDAASPVNSVIVLLESGATDATAVSTLIDAALGAL